MIEGASSLTIPLHNRSKQLVGHAIVSVEDFETISKHKWSMWTDTTQKNPRKYALSCIDGIKIKMHHLVLAVREVGKVVDHRNNDGLDNRRENLSLVTYQQNSQNKKKRDGCSSQYIGVSWNKTKKKWSAKSCGQSLGRFDSELLAAAAYDRYVLNLFGKDVRMNNVPQPTTWTEHRTKTSKYALPADRKPNKQGKFSAFVGKTYLGVHNTAEQAISAETTFRNEMQRTQSEKRLALPILRNNMDQAIIICRDIAGKNKASIIVDDTQWHHLMQWTWHLDSGNYAMTRIDGKTIRMHNYLMRNDDKAQVVDHINKNRIDNQLRNLRIVTRSGNAHNATKSSSRTSSIYRGVYFTAGRWRGQITNGKQRINFSAENELETAKLYDIHAKRIWGENANLNFPEIC